MQTPYDPRTDQAHPVVVVTQRTDRTPVFQVLVVELQQRIHQGDWLPGDRLPSSVQLAKALAVSTGSVREALRSLQSLGLVQITHGSGVFVTRTHASPKLADLFHPGQSDSRVARAEARCIVEPELAALAAERGSDMQLGAIEQLAREMEEQAQADVTFTKRDAHFHCCIAQAACNPTLARMIEHSIAVSLEREAMTSLTVKTVTRTVRYHLLIAEALCQRNAPQARLLMLAHMTDVVSDAVISEK